MKEEQSIPNHILYLIKKGLKELFSSTLQNYIPKTLANIILSNHFLNYPLILTPQHGKPREKGPTRESVMNFENVQ